LSKLAARFGVSDVALAKSHPPMAGQIFASIPGRPCMWCASFLTEDSLAKEAAKYGDAGGRPQVVWANGVLASTEVGLGVDLLTGWTRSEDLPIYLVYEANRYTVKPHLQLEFMPQECV
jgi:molybdopterin-synthase adenylyltransferase